MLDTVKKVARWAGPAVGLVALYASFWGVPSLAATAALVGAGVLSSWGVPKLVDKVKNDWMG